MLHIIVLLYFNDLLYIDTHDRFSYAWTITLPLLSTDFCPLWFYILLLPIGFAVFSFVFGCLRFGKLPDVWYVLPISIMHIVKIFIFLSNCFLEKKNITISASICVKDILICSINISKCDVFLLDRHIAFTHYIQYLIFVKKFSHNIKHSLGSQAQLLYLFFQMFLLRKHLNVWCMLA